MSRLIRLAVVSSLASLLAGCPTISTTDGGPLTIGPNGTDGILIDTASGIGLSVPKGALTEDTLITVTVVDTNIPEVPMRKRISLGYRISPASIKFATPITLYIPWQESRLVKGVASSTYDMRRQTTSDPFLALPGSAARPETKTVEAQTDRLGLFWNTSPLNPDVATLTLTPEEAFIDVGQTQQFTAEVKDPTGEIIPVELHWSAVAPRIGSITDGPDGGLYTALDPGIATVTVRAGNESAEAKVHVKGPAVGPATFVHENPFPTGNDLWGGSVGPIGTAFVGTNGTVLIRDTNGSYSRVFSQPGFTLKGIAGTTLTNAVAIGVLGTTGILVELTNNQPRVTTHPTANPSHLWFDGTHGMAVGTGNDVLVRRGGQWVKEYNPSFEPLLSVVGDGAGGFVVLGGQGSIYKYDPLTMRWNSLFQTQLAVLLTAGALTNASGSEAWACGGNKMWHFANDQWTSFNMPATPLLTEATALGLVDGKIVVGGRENKTGYGMIWTPPSTEPDGGMAGDTWVTVPMRGPQIPRGYFGQGTASTVGYLVGDYGAVWRYQANGLVEESHGFYGDVASVVTAGADVLVGVNECANSNCTAFTPHVYQRDAAGTFSFLGGSAAPFGGRIWSMAAKSKNDLVVAVSQPNGSGGQFWFFNGTVWSPAVGSGTALSLKYCGTPVIGVGVAGAWFRGGPTNVAPQGAIGMDHLWAVTCRSDAELWAGGDGVLFTRRGSGMWMPRDSEEVGHAPYRALYSPGEGEVFAFGDARFGTYWDTTTLRLVESPGGTSPDVISGLWASSPDNLYAVGVTQIPVSSGLGLRFNGAEWRQVDTGSQRAVTSIDGTAATTVFIGSRGGGVLRGVAPP
ncbi:MAG: Ig-like domain-containing protein [Myxococcaceae bacterium]|nr:Ig-like domain-containing protein [Myxococcaceae bacterium]